MIAWVKRRWSPDEFSRFVAILAGGTALGQAVVVLASPLITRLYEPADFGTYGAAASLISILAILTPLGYQRAIALPESRADTAAVVVLSLMLSVVTCAMTALVLGFFGTPLLDMLNAPALAPFLWVIVIGQFGAAAYMIVSMWAVRARHFAAIARTRLIQGVGLVGFQLALSGLGGGLGLLLGDVIGRTAGTTRLGGEMWRQDGAELRKVRLPDIRAAAVRYRRFPMYTNVSSLLDTVGLELPILLLIALYGPSVGGLYLLVARVAGLPTALIGVAAGQVFLAEAARMAADIPRLRLLFAATWRRLLKLGIVPALLGAVLAPFVFPFVFGPDWAEAGIYFTLLTPMFLLQFATAPTGSVLGVLERLDLHLIREILRLVLILAAVLVAVWAGTDAVVTVAMLSLAGCLGYVVYLVMSWYALSASEEV